MRIVIVLLSFVLENAAIAGMNCNAKTLLSSVAKNVKTDFHYGIVCTKAVISKCVKDAAWKKFYLQSSVTACSYFGLEDATVDRNGNGQVIVNRVNWGRTDYFYVEKNKRLGLVMIKEGATATGSSINLNKHFIYLDVPEGSPTMKCFESPAVTITEPENVVTTGDYYCEITAPCGGDGLNRPCEGADLKIRTGTLTFTADVLSSGLEAVTTREMVNNFLFLKNTAKATLACTGAGGTVKWYKNAATLSGASGASHPYEHTGKDTIIQCIGDSKAYTWNMFTIEDPENKKENVEETIQRGKMKELKCPEAKTAGDDTPFPTCTQVWYFKKVDANSVFSEISINSTLTGVVTNVTHILEDPQISEDRGNYRCQQVNGEIPDKTKVWQQDTDLEFNTANMIKTLTPSNKVKNWYEFDVQRREAYYMSHDVIQLECNVTMAENASLWWNFGDGIEKWHHGENGAPSKWTLSHVKEDKKDGYDQTFTAVKQGLADLVSSENTTMYAFIVMSEDKNKTDIVFDNITAEHQQYIQDRQSLLIRTFKGSAVAPLVGGPGGYVMPERTSVITLRCSDHTGIPPPHVSWLFKNYTANITTNITHELMQVRKLERFNKFKETRVKDRESEMIIAGGVAEDSGWYWCQMRNRNSMDEGNRGTTNFTDIPCDEEDFWCPNGSTRDWVLLWQILAVMLVVWLS